VGLRGASKSGNKRFSWTFRQGGGGKLPGGTDDTLGSLFVERVGKLRKKGGGIESALISDAPDNDL